MKAADLRQLIIKRRDASFKHVNGELSRVRKEAMQFYRGDNLSVYGDSGDGLSTVVSRDLMEAIESMMPSLVKPFVSGDEVVRFDPTGPEDEEPAKQATEYVNYLFANHNDPFRIIYDSIKDGLLARYGAAKVVYETVQESKFERYQALTQEEVEAVSADDKQTVVGDTIEQNQDGTFNVRVQVTGKRPMYRVIVIPPEQFLYEARLASLDEATFLAHHEEKPVGDLIAMGLPKAKCQALQPGQPQSMEDDERFRYDNDQENLSDDDPARKVWVDECYIRCDYEGDGTLQWRRVIVGGNDTTILLDEEADDHPFEGWTPIPEPHKLVGMGVYDLVRDIQMQKTALKREGLNALYLANRPMREVVEGQVNIDDLLSPSVGGVVRVKQAGMVTPIPSGGEGVMQQSLAMVEALDAEREARTGVTRYNQGMDANSLNKTATGVSIITNASQQRQELIARQYAESFLKGVFRKLLKLVSRYQDKAEVIRLRGEWVEMDPRDWKTGYDMSIAVGLGTGNKDQQIAHLNALTQVQAQIAQAQDGLDGPILTWENVFATVKMYPELMGLKGAEKFFTDPAKQQEDGGEQQPDPEQAAQAQAAQQAQEQQAAEQERHAAELAQKHDTAVETARISAEASVTVARIGAVKEMVLAGLTVADAEAVTDAAEDGAMPEHHDVMPPTNPQPAVEGDDMSQMMPQGDPGDLGDIDPEILAQMMQQPPQDDGLPPEMQLG